jgi:hypothetical protein
MLFARIMAADEMYNKHSLVLRTEKASDGTAIALVKCLEHRQYLREYRLDQLRFLSKLPLSLSYNHYHYCRS